MTRRLTSLGLIFLVGAPAIAGPMRASIRVSPSSNAVCPFTNALPIQQALAGSDKVGGWWVLQGDGTMLTGSAFNLNPIGAPTTTRWPVCPSGNSCSEEVQTILNPTATNTQYFQSGLVIPPTGSFTTCFIGAPDQPTKTGAALPESPGVVLMTLAGVAAWDTFSSTGATSDTKVSCLTACASNLTSGATIRQREQVMMCGIFNAGVQTKSCTFTQGSSAATCTAFAHTTAQVNANPQAWSVGRSSGVGNTSWHGMFRGAFMTEKAMSTADLSRIGLAMIPGAPGSMVFTRNSQRTCCAGVKCTTVAANVPCSNSCVAGTEVAHTNYIKTSAQRDGSEGIGNWATEFSSVPFTPTLTANSNQSPFGITSMDRVTFVASTTGQYSAIHHSSATVDLGNPSMGQNVAAIVSMYIAGVSSSGSIDVCMNQFSFLTAGPFCGVCNYSTTVTRCAVPLTISQYTVGGMDLELGAEPRYSGRTSPANDVYITNVQFELLSGSTPTSYINTQWLGSQTIPIETCTGVGCP